MRDVISLEFAKFPVKFPVSREFCGRLARTALHRQPRSPAFMPISREVPERAANCGLCIWPPVSRLPFRLFGGAKSPKVSGRFRKYSRFQETTAGDLVRTPLPGEGGSKLRQFDGVHTGEVEMMGDDVGGIAVHIAARVAQHAKASEVLASSTVKDLVAGAGLKFVEQGPVDLKGLAEPMRLFAAVT